MSKKKDCFGSETYVCMTRDCPYVSDCVQVVWENKMDAEVAKQKAGAKRRGVVSSAKHRRGPRVRSKQLIKGKVAS